jgi:hypothetical protein
MIFAFTACTKEIPYTGKNDALSVCNAFISPDQKLKIHLSHSANITGAMVALAGATIKVYENDELRSVDFIEEDGYYSSGFRPVAGSVYSLDVWKKGIKLLSACDTIPDSVIVENPTWQFPVGMMDEWTQAGLVRFSFTDNKQTNNYYEIMLAGKSDEEELRYNYLMEINNDFISLNTDQSWQNIRSILFSDSLIQGKTVDIQIRSQGTVSSRPIVILRNVSRSYYWYRKQLPVHLFLQGRERDIDLSFFRGEPVDMFTNIIGGLGVFYAYNQDIKECQVFP